MNLSSLAAHFAAEINAHEWSDSPFRFDRAGHRRDHDGHKRTAHTLEERQTDLVKANVAMVVAQVLGYVEGENFDAHEFVYYAGVARDIRLNSRGQRSGGIDAALRTQDGSYDTPGSTLTLVMHDAHSLDDAMAGVLKAPEEDPLHFAPRTTVRLRWNGQTYGEGVVSVVDSRHGWKVVVWDRYANWSVPR